MPIMSRVRDSLVELADELAEGALLDRGHRCAAPVARGSPKVRAGYGYDPQRCWTLMAAEPAIRYTPSLSSILPEVTMTTLRPIALVATHPS